MKVLFSANVGFGYTTPMRLLFALLLFALPLAAAPVPKGMKNKPPPVTLHLHQMETRPDVLTLVVSNTTDAPLTWHTTTIALEAFELELTDAKGKAVPFTHPAALHSPLPAPGNEVKVDAGGMYGMTFRVSTLLECKVKPAGEWRLTATFKHDGRTYQSETLEVK